MKKITISTAERMIYETIVKSIYTNPKKASIRELLANAVDANMTQPENVPLVDLTLNRTCIIIRDYGPGMSPETITKIYGSVYKSTKTGDNSSGENGQHGLGSKAPYGYLYEVEESTRKCKFYTVRSIHQGISYSYIMCLSEDGIPSYELAFSTETTDPSGVEIVLPFSASPSINSWFSEVVGVIIPFVLGNDKPLINIEGDNEELIQTIEFIKNNSFDVNGVFYLKVPNKMSNYTHGISGVKYKNIVYPVCQTLFDEYAISNYYDDDENPSRKRLYKLLSERPEGLWCFYNLNRNSIDTSIKTNKSRDRIEWDSVQRDTVNSLISKSAYRTVTLLRDIFNEILETVLYNKSSKRIHLKAFFREIAKTCSPNISGNDLIGKYNSYFNKDVTFNNPDTLYLTQGHCMLSALKTIIGASDSDIISVLNKFNLTLDNYVVLLHAYRMLFNKLDAPLEVMDAAKIFCTTPSSLYTLMYGTANKDKRLDYEEPCATNNTILFNADQYIAVLNNLLSTDTAVLVIDQKGFKNTITHILTNGGFTKVITLNKKNIPSDYLEHLKKDVEDIGDRLFEVSKYNKKFNLSVKSPRVNNITRLNDIYTFAVNYGSRACTISGANQSTKTLETAYIKDALGSVNNIYIHVVGHSSETGTLDFKQNPIKQLSYEIDVNQKNAISVRDRNNTQIKIIHNNEVVIESPIHELLGVNEAIISVNINSYSKILPFLDNKKVLSLDALIQKITGWDYDYVGYSASTFIEDVHRYAHRANIGCPRLNEISRVINWVTAVIGQFYVCNIEGASNDLTPFKKEAVRKISSILVNNKSITYDYAREFVNIMVDNVHLRAKFKIFSNEMYCFRHRIDDEEKNAILCSIINDFNLNKLIEKHLTKIDSM